MLDVLVACQPPAISVINRVKLVSRSAIIAAAHPLILDGS
jgi:hypothetical protein